MKASGNYIVSVFIVVCIACGIVFAQEQAIGYKEFKLGMSYDAVKNTLASQYNGSSIKYATNGDIHVALEGMIQLNLMFDQKKFLYKIAVELNTARFQK